MNDKLLARLLVVEKTLDVVVDDDDDDDDTGAADDDDDDDDGDVGVSLLIFDSASSSFAL